MVYIFTLRNIFVFQFLYALELLPEYQQGCIEVQSEGGHNQRKIVETLGILLSTVNNVIVIL